MIFCVSHFVPESLRYVSDSTREHGASMAGPGTRPYKGTSRFTLVMYARAYNLFAPPLNENPGSVPGGGGTSIIEGGRDVPLDRV